MYVCACVCVHVYFSTNRGLRSLGALIKLSENAYNPIGERKYALRKLQRNLKCSGVWYWTVKASRLLESGKMSVA